MIFTNKNPKMFDVKKNKVKEFEMTNIREMSYFLGIEV